MRKWQTALFLMLLSQLGWAQTQEGYEAEHGSPTAYIVIGALVVIIAIFMLYNKQKRKYND
ncbi:hypothetical protein ACL9RF_12565 [Sphingobacterium sp. Mn56C]|uniref:hypothetical protein n=1 Tax=Sphingobacterium sp. Mn56C TaxID=3395261 RepID=UPI003BE34A36